MTLRTWFPCAMTACLTLSMLSVSVVAQTGGARQNQLARTNEALTPAALKEDPVVLSVASPEEIKAATTLGAPTLAAAKFQQLMLAAIDDRLGARYRWGGTGPSGFDCSGFVWSTFQSIGINFERGSARTLWSRFTPATPEEENKFGTLVFFSNLRHIGIVADANGFYHASRHHGVVYSPFNDYWLSRIDGFRRVPVSSLTAAE
jgi:cell wall-associated NlpC family hydrolase